ncbi:MAG TPA: DUF1570 domain-containing protein [Isosphaeraceae bacterium]|nr:DUF1570 domain-containing protein [Isosphaeraceae bacterium]
MRRAGRIAMGTWAGWLVLAGSVRAELIYFAKGGRAQLPATTQGASVRLVMPDGWLDFDRKDFRKVVPGHWPEREWESRRESALKSGVEARYAAAWWALENGLTPQAVEVLRELHAADPQHEPTARMVAAQDRLAKPCADPDLGPLRRALDARFEVVRSPHVILLHQHSTADAAERLDLCERVVTSYYLLLASQGIELPAPRSRMASAWFAEQKDYLAFLKSEGAEAFRATRGYFHPTLNAVVAFDARSTDAQRHARERLAARLAELDRVGATVDQMTHRTRLGLDLAGEPTRALTRTEARDLLERLRREVRRQRLLLELDRRAIDWGTAAHETIHQLVAASGLAPRHDDLPLWLHEGFAAQFEVVRGGRWAGIGRAHDIRLPDWRAIDPAPRLAPLLRDTGFGRGYRRDLYAQAWALVYYLRKQHPREFLTLLDLLRTPDDDGSPHADRTVAAFRRAFGDDLDRLESDWHRFMGALRTPLESEAMPDGPEALPPARAR